MKIKFRMPSGWAVEVHSPTCNNAVRRLDARMPKEA